ncbi:axin-related protein-like [Myxocyprinus asiaticus]|uniref:axin-related protein-like n=1 Tax=Myxocyprinus asiaticus TaxID=70543 RepID=UPI00222302C3|nr:axin-related protein-like [Myxocyprinus asiaticus]
MCCVKKASHTFAAELMRRLQDLQTQTQEEEVDNDLTNVTLLSRNMALSPAHSHCCCDTVSQWQDTHKVNVTEHVKKNPAHTHTDYGCVCESVTVVYYLCGECIPYRTSVQGDGVTLAQFKSLLTRRGPYRFYFKRTSAEFDCGVVYEEIREDDAVLPTFEDKIIAKVERRMDKY